MIVDWPPDDVCVTVMGHAIRVKTKSNGKYLSRGESRRAD